MRLATSRPLPIAIPVAALADLSLLLVAFFFLLSIHGADSAPLELPGAASTPVSALGSAYVVVLRRPSLGSVESLSYQLSDGRGPASTVGSLDTLYLEASRLTEEQPDRTFLLKADTRVAYAVVDDVIETLRRAGVNRIVLWTRFGGTQGVP